MINYRQDPLSANYLAEGTSAPVPRSEEPPPNQSYQNNMMGETGFNAGESVIGSVFNSALDNAGEAIGAGPLGVAKGLFDAVGNAVTQVQASKSLERGGTGFREQGLNFIKGEGTPKSQEQTVMDTDGNGIVTRAELNARYGRPPEEIMYGQGDADRISDGIGIGVGATGDLGGAKGAGYKGSIGGLFGIGKADGVDTWDDDSDGSSAEVGGKSSGVYGGDVKGMDVTQATALMNNESEPYQGTTEATATAGRGKGTGTSYADDAQASGSNDGGK